MYECPCNAKNKKPFILGDYVDCPRPEIFEWWCCKKCAKDIVQWPQYFPTWEAAKEWQREEIEKGFPDIDALGRELDALIREFE